MKGLLYTLVGVAILAGGALLFMNMQQREQVDPNTLPEEETGGERVTEGTYSVDTERSSVSWAGGKPGIVGYVHRGTLSLSGGEIEVSGESATGTFVIDMNSLRATSLGGGKEGGESALERHLKSNDFFNVEEHPTTTLEIVSVSEIAGNRYTVTGNLTMLGTTEEISFPADIFLTEAGVLRAQAEFSIDRTRWNITFGSGSFFDNLAENAIDNEIELSLNLYANLLVMEEEMEMEEEDSTEE